MEVWRVERLELTKAMKSVRWEQLQVTEVEEKSRTEQPSSLREEEVSLKKRHSISLFAITRSFVVVGAEENTASTSRWTAGREERKGI